MTGKIQPVIDANTCHTGVWGVTYPWHLAKMAKMIFFHQIRWKIVKKIIFGKNGRNEIFSFLPEFDEKSFFPKIFFEDISIVSFGLKMLKKNKNDTRSFDSKFLFAENSFESNFDGHKLWLSACRATSYK